MQLGSRLDLWYRNNSLCVGNGMEWNHHRIRKSSTAEAPGGIPEVLYHLPPEGSGIIF